MSINASSCLLRSNLYKTNSKTNRWHCAPNLQNNNNAKEQRNLKNTKNLRTRKKKNIFYLLSTCNRFVRTTNYKVAKY